MSRIPLPTADPTPRRPQILLGVTGSVAAVKAPEIAVRLACDLNMDVRILLTRGGRNFWDKACDYNAEYWGKVQQYINSTDNAAKTDRKDQEGTIRVHDADEEWNDWNRLGDPVLHIDLRDWADALVIAPLSAHTLAKLAIGLCDDTLSCVVRAWDFGHGTRPGKPLFLAPAMNTAMWQHPLTKQQLDTLRGFWNHRATVTDKQQKGVVIVQPQVKALACGEVGNGALAPIEDILLAVQEILGTSLTAADVL